MPNQISTLIYDTRSRSKNGRPFFSGSCGLVAHFFRNALQKMKHDVQEIYVPLTDKTSSICIPASRQFSRHKPGVHVFFEELFARAEKNSEYHRLPKIVFFNLHFFQKIEKLCEADLLIFNSQYLLDCFRMECARLEISVPPMTVLPLPLPLLEFPEGYPSNGADLALSTLRSLQKDYFLGHALRGRKQDCFATLSILHQLNTEAKKRSLKPFLLMVSASAYENYQQALAASSLPPETIDALLPMPLLKHKALVQVMQHSHFSLCYDQVREAYGFYPAESVFLKCPVFTNGSGNLRYLLPPDHGIFTQETLDMHFGDEASRIAAYHPVALNIIEKILSGSGAKACQKGRKYLQKHHSQAAFNRELKLQLNEIPKRTILERKKLKPNPYLRIFDKRTGQGINDHERFMISGNSKPDPKVAYR